MVIAILNGAFMAVQEATPQETYDMAHIVEYLRSLGRLWLPCLASKEHRAYCEQRAYVVAFQISVDDFEHPQPIGSLHRALGVPQAQTLQLSQNGVRTRVDLSARRLVPLLRTRIRDVNERLALR